MQDWRKRKMKCPYCKKTLDRRFLTTSQYTEILQEIKERKHSITSLTKKLDMKRSTLVYYLQVLEAKGFIKTDKLKQGKGARGQPTMIKYLSETK